MGLTDGSPQLQSNSIWGGVLPRTKAAIQFTYQPKGPLFSAGSERRIRLSPGRDLPLRRCYQPSSEMIAFRRIRATLSDKWFPPCAYRGRNSSQMGIGLLEKCSLLSDNSIRIFASSGENKSICFSFTSTFKGLQIWVMTDGGQECGFKVAQTVAVPINKFFLLPNTGPKQTQNHPSSPRHLTEAYCKVAATVTASYEAGFVYKRPAPRLLCWMTGAAGSFGVVPFMRINSDNRTNTNWKFTPTQANAQGSTTCSRKLRSMP